MNRSAFLLTALLGITGCSGAQVFRARPPMVNSAALPHGEAGYCIGCADVLEVAFINRPDWDCYASVGIDGQLPLGEAGTVLVEGSTVEEVRSILAAKHNLDLESVRVRVAAPRSSRVYVCGPEAHRQRTVPYCGPESVVAFLWRAGAVKQGCTDLHDIAVVRPNVAAGGKPEVFQVDFADVVLDGDQSTNVVLRPSDLVYVGETRRSRFSRLLPDWLRPLYRKLVGMLPPDGWPWAGAGRGGQNPDKLRSNSFARPAISAI